MHAPLLFLLLLLLNIKKPPLLSRPGVSGLVLAKLATATCTDLGLHTGDPHFGQCGQCSGHWSSRPSMRNLCDFSVEQEGGCDPSTACLCLERLATRAHEAGRIVSVVSACLTNHGSCAILWAKGTAQGGRGQGFVAVRSKLASTEAAVDHQTVAQQHQWPRHRSRT